MTCRQAGMHLHRCVMHAQRQLLRHHAIRSPSLGAATHQASCSTVARASSSNASPGVDRAYPPEPRVGVGVVVFRRPEAVGQPADLLLIRRGKEPNKGQWCFPGGSLELGETMAECAVREVAEETGVAIQHMPGKEDEEEGFSADLRVPTAFAAVDVMMKDGDRLKYHYAIIEVAALVGPEHASSRPQALDDASEAMWLPVSQVRSLQGLVPKCAGIMDEALRRFSVISQPQKRQP